MDKDLENKIKIFMAEKLASGEKLSDLQDEVNSEFGLKLTYMDIRILASALPVDWKSRDPQKAPAKEEKVVEKQDAAAEAVPAEEPAPAAAAGNTVVEINKIARPGMAISGTVKFANGATADWYVDQMGRLGLDNLKGDNPTREDIEAFQIELQKVLR